MGRPFGSASQGLGFEPPLKIPELYVHTPTFGIEANQLCSRTSKLSSEMLQAAELPLLPIRMRLQSGSFISSLAVVPIRRMLHRMPLPLARLVLLQGTKKKRLPSVI
jgi:hypothetical protein